MCGAGMHAVSSQICSLLQQSLYVNDDAKLSNGVFGSQNCGHFKILKYLQVCNKGLNLRGLYQIFGHIKAN
jgi:hypothetical protein